MSLFAELKRRNVIRMAGLYLVGAWLIVQVAETLLPAFDIPGWVLRATIILLAIGFVPAMIFAWIFELTPQGLKRDEDVVANESIAPQTAQRMNRTLLVVSLLAIAYFAFDKFVLAPQREAALVEVTAAQISAEADADKSKTKANSIAVLPFVNMSGDQANEYFSDGISEEILNVLAGVAELQVAARTSSFSFKGKNLEVPEIAKALNVRMVLEGSVRQQGDTVRITAQLINAETGFHLWSETYDRKLQDIFAIQDEIARAIGDELKVKVGIDDKSAGGAGATTDVAAYELYLHGMALWHARGEKNMLQAIDLFKQALDIDPGFAPAYAGLALTTTILPAYSSTMSWEEGIRQSQNYAVHALALDPTLPEAYASLANSANMSLQRDTAEALLRRAIAMRPSFATAHHWLGNTLQSLGDMKGSLLELELATALDPRSPVIGDNHAFALIAAGRTAEARERCERVLEFSPMHHSCLQYIGIVDLMDRNWDAAQFMLERLVNAFDSKATQQPRELVDALAGRTDRHALALKLAALPFNTLVDNSSDNVLEDQIVLLVLMMLEEPGLALDFMERQAGNFGTTMDWGIVMIQLDPIRCEPRFQAIVKTLKANDERYAEVCKGKPAP